jgi:hypothetical protein
MILDELFENNLPPNIKPSDLPPGMRQRLSMRDIEAERPRGAFRYRVGDKSFMDLKAAQEFARGTGEKVQSIGEAADEKKVANPRIERILKMLRAKHPQAENDLEALILDFRTQQGQDRRDIGRLDMENDQEEADIERLEKILANLKQQRELAETTNKRRVMRDENENIIDETKKDACYDKVKSRYKVWPSAYASGALVQCRKKGAANWGDKS